MTTFFLFIFFFTTVFSQKIETGTVYHVDKYNNNIYNVTEYILGVCSDMNTKGSVKLFAQTNTNGTISVYYSTYNDERCVDINTYYSQQYLDTFTPVYQKPQIPNVVFEHYPCRRDDGHNPISTSIVLKNYLYVDICFQVSSTEWKMFKMQEGSVKYTIFSDQHCATEKSAIDAWRTEAECYSNEKVYQYYYQTRPFTYYKQKCIGYTRQSKGEGYVWVKEKDGTLSRYHRHVFSECDPTFVEKIKCFKM